MKDSTKLLMGAAYIGVAYYAISALMNRNRNAGQTEGLLGQIVNGRKALAQSPYSITNMPGNAPSPTGYVDVMGHNHGGAHIPMGHNHGGAHIPMGGYHEETEGYAGMLSSQFGNKGIVGNLSTRW